MSDDRDLLEYILSQIEILQSYLVDVDEDLFLRNDVLRDACMMKVVVIGEYSSKLSNELKTRFSEVEWQLLKSARNYYVHAYGFVNWRRVWETLSEYIPDLKVKIEKMIPQIG
ncbi:MAG: DUF86 domain-containing protein [Taibaiella sp.]|nr:DUF86 domain-containing protein [Taibaiella sp.]